jgi:hypothetical protein
MNMDCVRDSAWLVLPLTTAELSLRIKLPFASVVAVCPPFSNFTAAPDIVPPPVSVTLPLIVTLVAKHDVTLMNTASNTFTAPLLVYTAYTAARQSGGYLPLTSILQ